MADCEFRNADCRAASDQHLTGQGELGAIADQPSTVVSRCRRIAAIGTLAVLAVAAGHYGLRLTGRRLWPSAFPSRSEGAWRPEAIALPPGATTIAGRRIADGERVFAQYACGMSAAAVENFLRSAMPAAGWKESQAAAAASVADGDRLLTYSNEKGNWCMIAVSEGPEETIVSVLHLRRLAAASDEPGGFDKEISR